MPAQLLPIRAAWRATIVASLLVFAAACSSEAPTPATTGNQVGGAPPAPPAMPGAASAAAPAPVPAPASASAPATSADGVLALPGLRCVPPAEWQSQAPANTMRVAQFVLPGPAEDAGPAELVIFHFGPGAAGTAQANIDRWIGQFEQPDGRASRDVATIGPFDGSAMKIDRIDVSGTYAGSMQPGAQPQPGARMLAAIVDTTAGPYYIKLVGPAQTVTHWESGFDSFLRSMQPAGS